MTTHRPEAKALTLVSDHLCPYVQRAAIVLAEKRVPSGQRFIDLANKPDWFLAISPIGKVPVLLVQSDHGAETESSRAQSSASISKRRRRACRSTHLRGSGGARRRQTQAPWPDRYDARSSCGFAGTLSRDDHVVVEATGNATAVTEILAPNVTEVAVANPLQVHLIAKAKIKPDAIDAGVLAKLYAAGFLPEVWFPDAATLAAGGR